MHDGWTGRLRLVLLGRVRIVMLVVGAIAALLVISSRLVDEGEVVQVTTVDAHGGDHVTELWIVDLPSGSYLRASSGDARWLLRLRERPLVTVLRAGHETRFRALPAPDAETRRRVNAAMSEKYGFADDFWGRFSDFADAVPIRLESSDETAAAP